MVDEWDVNLHRLENIFTNYQILKFSQVHYQPKIKNLQDTDQSRSLNGKIQDLFYEWDTDVGDADSYRIPKAIDLDRDSSCLPKLRRYIRRSFFSNRAKTQTKLKLINSNGSKMEPVH